MDFYSDDANLFSRMLVLQQLVAEQQFRSSPCPLLEAQLIEAEVLTNKLLQDIKAMQKIVAKKLKDKA